MNTERPNQTSKDKMPPSPPHAGDDAAATDGQQQHDEREAEDAVERRSQAIKDKSLGAPVTGMPGSTEPARR
ncbi:hypothetical protein [Nannocystis pusilla]|uniref:Uncharacterized protein n=1 Tax=Nannocystis pusilla TaxID=889268 RepID=A0ABS7U5Y4_9BACT|nr:hypothetical protein [Nannocystis pusilla]MBZ5715666.1 hypothetical protein [Nannocystis pusilla]